MGDAVTTIRANCPSCGDVQLTADDLTVRVCADDERGSYCFRCPDCRQAVAKEASRRIVDLLVSSGVRMQVWRLPGRAERVADRPAAHARRPPRLPPAPRRQRPGSRSSPRRCAARSTGRVGACSGSSRSPLRRRTDRAGRARGPRAPGGRAHRGRSIDRFGREHRWRCATALRPASATRPTQTAPATASGD